MSRFTYCECPDCQFSVVVSTADLAGDVKGALTYGTTMRPYQAKKAAAKKAAKGKAKDNGKAAKGGAS